MDFYILLVCFFFIAMIYSSVGFGGGSSYLALMGVMAVAIPQMRSTALLCNIIVVTGGTAIYYRENLVDLKKSWPFLVASVPLAFLGGQYPVRENTFFQLLGASLVAAALLLWFTVNTKEDRDATKPSSSDSGKILAGAAIGGGIGFLSGLVSIGGGIFLSPVLHLIRWDNSKKIAALASLFILVNSVSGLAGMMTRSTHLKAGFVIPLLIAVFIGGQIGSRLGANRFNAVAIKRITAVLILVAGLNILKDHF